MTQIATQIETKTK